MTDALISQVRELAWKGQPLNKVPQTVPGDFRRVEDREAAEVLRAAQSARGGNQGFLSTTSRSSQVSRSKRKIAFTLSGPVVGFGLGVVGAVVGAAILGTGPIGVAAVVGAAVVAVTGAAAAYALRKGWRNARAAYYAHRYVQRDEHGYIFTNTREALNGVRYVIQKRQLSRISDDIKELHLAIRDFEEREKQGINCCQDAAELVYRYHRVHLLVTPIGEHLQLFKQFYEYLRKELEGALHGVGEHAKADCLSDENIIRALTRAHEWVCNSSHSSSWCLTPLPGMPAICYKHNSSGKPIKPFVTVWRSLSEEERRPFVRLMNDAYYIAHHGEHTAMASYTDMRDEMKTLFPGIDLDIFFQPSAPTPPSASTVPPVPPSGSGSILTRDPSAGDLLFQGDEDSAEVREGIKGAGIGLGKQAAAVSASAAKTATVAAVRGTPDVGLQVGVTAAGGGISAAGAIVMSIAQAAVEARNLKNELRAVSEEYGKGLDQMNVERMLTGLRTVLKDGGFFEACVDEAAKMIEYQREFSNVMALHRTSGGMSCGVAYETVYRILKSYKHFVQLAARMPFVKQFAEIANGVLEKAKELDRAEDIRVNQKVKRWVEEGDHNRCKNNGLCYGGTEF